MNYKKMICQNCGNEFVWSAEEQRLYAQRGLSEPAYCPICRGMMEAREKDTKRNTYER